MTQENTALLDTKKAALIDGMLERIHWQIDCEVKREDVAELIECLDEYGMAFVSIPQWICASEAQHGVDAYFKGDADSRLIEAARAVVDGRRSSYKAKNGRDVSIEAGDGEKVYLVHSELMFELQSAYEALKDRGPASPTQSGVEAAESATRICGTCGGYGLARGGACWTCGGTGKEPVAIPATDILTHDATALLDIVAKLAKSDCECDSYNGFTDCLSCQARAAVERAGGAGEVEPSGWTGSGSMAALKDGREGFIWPAKSDAHPIPLYARPRGEVIALQLDRKVGMYGSAYDPPGPCRAYTYEHQPSNLPAYSLGRAHAAAAAMSAGDNIDRGLGLLKALEDQGFGVFEIEQGGAGDD